MDVTSAPQYIEPLKHRILDDIRQNHTKYAALKREIGNTSPITEVYPDAMLYTKGRRYFVLDHIKEKVTYYMQWDDRKIFGRRAAYQVLVWSDISTPDVRGFASEIFFEVLFVAHDIIVTDRLQTPSGRRLWHHLIAVALNENYPIYLVDLIKKTKTEMQSLHEIETLADHIWPEKQTGKSRLLCVAKTAF